MHTSIQKLVYLHHELLHVSAKYVTVIGQNM